MAIVLDWKKRLGYRRDPFENTIFKPVTNFTVGTDTLQERLSLFLIREERFGSIAGEDGTGKTTLLRWMQEELAKKREFKPHYLDCKFVKNRSELMKALVPMTRLGIAEKLSRLGFSKKKISEEEQEKDLIQRLKIKRHLLLLDNAGALKENAVQLLGQILEETKTYIIIVDEKKRLSSFSNFNDKLKLNTPKYTYEDLSTLLTKRIEEVAEVEGTYPFQQADITQLAKKAENNPEKFLNLAKEKAIELSLKAEPAPKKSKKTSVQVQKKRKIGFLNIEIQRGKTVKKEPLPQIENEELNNAIKEDLEELKKDLLPPSPEKEEEIVIDEKDEDVVVIDETPGNKKPKKSEFDVLIGNITKPEKGNAKKPKKKVSKKPVKKANKKKR